jgi:hypothetical protein
VSGQGNGLVRFGLGANFNDASIEVLNLETDYNADYHYGNIAANADTIFVTMEAMPSAPTQDVRLAMVPVSSFTGAATTSVQLANYTGLGIGVLGFSPNLALDNDYLWMRPSHVGLTIPTVTPLWQVPLSEPSAFMAYENTTPPGVVGGNTTTNGERFGQYVYFADSVDTAAAIIAIDASNPNAVPGSAPILAMDPGALPGPINGTPPGYYQNCASDGTYVYFAPLGTGNLLRVPLWGALIVPPTFDPHVVGALWNNGGTPAISAG